MNQQGTTDEAVALTPWEAGRYVRKLDPRESRYSRGFLRCRPEKWFPGFPTHWLPLAHSLGVELKAIEVKPMLAFPSGLEVSYGGTVDGEPIRVAVDAASCRILLNAFVPGSNPAGNEIVIEYLARRFMASLAMSWSGPQSSVVQFDSQAEHRETDVAGVVKFTGSVNGDQIVIWMALGKSLVERLDGLWRRQVQSTVKPQEGGASVSIEVSQLAVPPTMLVDYLKAGTIIDLEVPLGDSVTLRLGGKAWQVARLCDIDGKVGFETLPGPVASPVLPEGTTRLSIQFGTVTLDAAAMAEMAQPGAIWGSSIPLSDVVQLIINGEKVGAATLCCYQGRFAITVA
ncbi:MAG: hypothetical protein J0M12_03125 [Deltaproteobacteria bacterium]|nr:hypothetical protein [Deltaproteobacteria bacterium]